MPSLAVMQRRLERWRNRQAQEGQVACALWENGPLSREDIRWVCQDTLTWGVLDRVLARMLRDKQVTREWRKGTVARAGTCGRFITGARMANRIGLTGICVDDPAYGADRCLFCNSQWGVDDRFPLPWCCHLMRHSANFTFVLWQRAISEQHCAAF